MSRHDEPPPPPSSGEPIPIPRDPSPRMLSGIPEGSPRLRRACDTTAHSTSDGQHFAWGENSGGQLGTGDLLHRDPPALAREGIAQVSAGARHSITLTMAGEVLAWVTAGMARPPATVSSSPTAVAGILPRAGLRPEIFTAWRLPRTQPFGLSCHIRSRSSDGLRQGGRVDPAISDRHGSDGLPEGSSRVLTVRAVSSSAGKGRIRPSSRTGQRGAGGAGVIPHFPSAVSRLASEPCRCWSSTSTFG